MKSKIYLVILMVLAINAVKAQKVDSLKLLMDVNGGNVGATTQSDDAVPVTISTYDKVSWGDGYGLANRAFIQSLRNEVLPITLFKFNAKKEADAIHITWSTSMEKNALHFEVLRSTDGKKFKGIATVGANGNSSSLQNYAYRDRKPENGTNYYQLKSVDRDGTFSTSIVVAVKFDLNKTDMVVAANSAHQTIKVSVYSPVATSATFSVADVNGRVLLKTKNLSIQKGNNVFEYPLNVPAQLLIAVLSSATEKSAFKFYY